MSEQFRDLHQDVEAFLKRSKVEEEDPFDIKVQGFVRKVRSNPIIERVISDFDSDRDLIIPSRKAVAVMLGISLLGAVIYPRDSVGTAATMGFFSYAAWFAWKANRKYGAQIKS